MRMVKAYVGLGTNIGDKEANIATALKHLNAEPGIRTLRVASLYHTEPVGFTEQEWFVNTVAEIETTLPPFDLMSQLLRIEQRMGRRRDVFWGPRIIDLDLLLYDNLHLAIPGLQIPHPRLIERAFVVIPLAELEPDMLLRGRRASDLGVELASIQKIELIP
ncbi:MAG: 2-amino-4-hydroxy-6-hydroxymethyldihydropteridine diphosphokinase [Firmicutes bacterium]|jgi:2-amino-4-hydroxy-6-hydroxymethyldihydropteridine diphosphokinase|nr:2-amino-4-hydroxy-6-hydroxymethyldihydropteridine diphosphokinase [Bacillota bacterium]MBV1726487.1 2-amino-4-hydroxy-6-hydroxymethyldihydropteridine diphosphokinase [Desulforudis sp.]MBV1734455.1 2-amino-4-hydroxy-6-hydroxymethyldihydropteridine diphosphokinase [Desulforudis sp.]MDP3050399.1 2-amino-4-hydroxy-6-hydroxymethyldihydropteridine diphosphokinase [Eubacteriales bacterium]